ncbi:MAG: hypothetical protein HRT90_03565 [Candidatus Margulisbacteria bacterium]|nr:hypothetical protein [Candidatus Margulisiibacteriota bacterium]
MDHISDRHIRSLHTLIKRYDKEKRKRDYVVSDVKELYEILFWGRDPDKNQNAPQNDMI